MINHRNSQNGAYMASRGSEVTQKEICTTSDEGLYAVQITRIEHLSF